jgi:hypothetical protein
MGCHTGDSREPFGSGPKELLAVCAIGLVFLFVAFLRTAPTPADVFAQPWDWHKYIYIAQHGPLGFHIAPFCWRILHPVIAGLLPWQIDTNFLVLALAETFLAAVLAYYVSRAAGFSQAAALMALIVFYSIPAAAQGSISNPWSVDQLSRVLVLAGFFFLLKGRSALACMAFAVGVCAKETVVIAAPLMYTWSARQWIDTRRLWRGALLAMPIVGTFLAVRLIIPAWNANPQYVNSLPFSLSQVYGGQTSFVYSELIRAMIQNDLASPRLWALKTISVTSFSVFAVLPFLAWRKNAVPFLRLLPFLALTYFAMLFSSGWDRVLVLAFPAVAVLALNGVHQVAKHTGAPEFLFTVAAVPIFLLTFFGTGHSVDRFLWQALVLLVALAIAVLWPKLTSGAGRQA